MIPLHPTRHPIHRIRPLLAACLFLAAALRPAVADDGDGAAPAVVVVNGRSLADAEIAWLMTLGPVWPGRYGLDAMGNVGLEGQALPFANLVQLAQAQAPRSGRTPGGSVVASDGRCVYVSGRSSNC